MAENLFICHNPHPQSLPNRQSSLEQREKSVLGTNLQGRKQGRPKVKAEWDRGAGGEAMDLEPSFWLSTLQPRVVDTANRRAGIFGKNQVLRSRTEGTGGQTDPGVCGLAQLLITICNISSMGKFF